ncbi:uncharacterized protein LOC124174029 [Ischnura elegans]|uniref:uncharacterized protein LOC124174029 n=1 Tax=Ischnura elegans TaxID=197161 RepID=UPI001ED8697D|nr:uncharacterized protein LOC124174029 [Ischnura elegans]
MDLHGCVMRVTVFDSPPACIPKRIGLSENEVEKLDGIQGYLLAELAKRMNFTPNIVQYYPENYSNMSNPFWPIFIPLLEHQTDMVLCEVVLTPRRLHILGEGFHHQWTCATFAVPISHPSNSWRLIGLASPPAWLALLIAMVLSCTAAWVVHKLQPNRYSLHCRTYTFVITDTVVAFVGVPIERPPKASSSRALFPAVCLAGLITTTAIQAHLSSFHSAPTPSWAPATLEELTEYKVRVGGPTAIKYLAREMESKSWRSVLQNYELHDEGTEALDINGVAVAGMRRNLLYRLSKVRSNKVLLKECPLPLPSVIFLRKGSAFQTQLKKIDQGLTSGGIINKWVHDVTRMGFSKVADSKYVTSGEKRKINLSEMEGVFVVLSLGLVASFVALLSEVALEKLTNYIT